MSSCRAPGLVQGELQRGAVRSKHAYQHSGRVRQQRGADHRHIVIEPDLVKRAGNVTYGEIETGDDQRSLRREAP